ncbi:MAG TPA: cation:proton antiporter, partial [Myxococcota bacterium]|nr:cation:proton antiporter [Myxococcota bacterium]
QSESGARPDRVRFGLAGEGALNDGSAFPFVLLGLGLLDLHPLGAWGWRWIVVDLLWSTLGGLILGAILGALIGNLVVYLRTRHRNAVGMDEFLSLGLIAISYGLAQLCLASGFLAVFAAGLALNRVRERPLAGSRPPIPADGAPGHESPNWSTHSHHASSVMTHAVRGFNEQLEKLAELTIVLILGALLPAAGPLPALGWFIPLLFVVLRPVAVLLSMAGRPMPFDQSTLICWFGIRGIGSIFYLMYALSHGVIGELAQTLVSFTLITIAASIFAHGVSVHPLMAWYASRRAKK